MSIVDQTKAPDTMEKRAAGNFGTGIVLDKWLSGAVTISSAEVLDFDGDDDLTISNVSVNASTYTRPKPNDSETYSAGKVIQYDISGGTAGETYDVPFKATLSNGDEVVIVVPWLVRP